MPACGLDFGTSNTTLGLVRPGATPALAPLEGDEVTMPSAIFFDWSANALIGRAAISAYVDGAQGRLLRSLKSALGGALIDEATQVGRKRLKFTQVIARYLELLKTRAEEAAGEALTQVVHGRPVHFVDGDADGDRRAEDALREIAHSIGFRDVSFQFEPIAAALDYERRVKREEIAMVVDIGGGTSDFSIVRLSPKRRGKADRGDDVLANGGARVGGVDFDRRLSLASVMPLLGFGSPMKRPGLDAPSGYFHDLATWASINRVYNQHTIREVRDVRRESARPELIERLLRVIEMQRGHTLAIDVERAKIALSDIDATIIDLGWLEEGLSARPDRGTLVASSERLTERIVQTIRDCLAQAALRADQVQALFLTGGTTQIPHVREAVTREVPEARVMDGDTFGSVGLGLTIEAQRRYG
ncbi:MAG: Hsp70 family protein [Beijerinckiaceae bacterium]